MTIAATRAPDTSDLFAQVEALTPLITAHAADAERRRRLSPVVATALREAGLFRLFRPHRHGGFELDPVTGFRLVEAVARVDSAAGWNVSLANAIEPWGAWLGEAASEEIFASTETVMAGAFNPPRRAVAVAGGYRVTGRTTFNSNCHAATWLIGLAQVHDDDRPRLNASGAPLTVITFVPAQATRIIENWETLGMSGTGSHDIEIDDVFVPEHHTAPLAPLTDPNPAYAGPFHRVAVWAGTACNAVPALGIAQAAIDDLLELGAKVPAYTATSLRDRSIVQRDLARAEGKLSAARALLHATYDGVWRQACEGRSPALADRARCQLAASHAVLASAEAVDLIHGASGTTGIRNAHRFQRHFRDAHVVTQHAFVGAARLEAVGQVMLGLEPDWPFFAF